MPDVSFDSLDEDALNRFVNYVKPALRQAIQQWIEQQQPAAGKSPFAVTFDEFVKMNVNEQRKLRHKALHENRDWIDHKLAEQDAEWIFVLGGTVERYSTSLDKLPSKKKIYAWRLFLPREAYAILATLAFCIYACLFARGPLN